MEILSGVEIGAGTSLTATTRGARLEIGADVFISGGCTLAAAELVEIGAESMVAELVSVRDYDHDPSMPPRSGATLVSPVRIGRRVWIGAKASVVRGAVVEDDVVIGAHALVNRPAPAGSLIAGVPARVVKDRVRA